MVPLRSIFRVALFAAFGLTIAAPSALIAQHNSAASAATPQVVPRVQGAVDDSVRVTLGGNVHPVVRTAANQTRADLVRSGSSTAAVDQGAVEDSLPAGRMLLLLARSPDQEEALQDYILAAHTPGSSSFHQWLTPEEFGSQFGPAASDVAAVTAWMESHGLTINRVHAGRSAIEFSATAGQIREAFQTEIHRYLVRGETHLANTADPTVPAALAPVIAGLAPINDFHPKSHLKVMGQAQFNPKTHQATPQWTYPAAGGVSYALAPGDFATQYDINPVYKAGITGTGQSIAIVSASNVDLSLVQAYQTLFGLTANLPQVVVDGVDPGQNSAATEAYLDIELAGSVAPGANVILYTSGGTALTDGLSLAAMRAVEDDLAGVISVSYGECELELGQSGNAFWSALWQQAAAQGQTVFVSAGDGGSADCDDFDAEQYAYGGLQVNGIASTPYNVAVGGTDFYFSQYGGSTSAIATQLATYWSASTTSPAVSLKQTVPEQVWNDFFGYNLEDGGVPASLASQTIVAGGGGASSAALYPTGTGQGYAKPAWQTGTGVPTDKVRDLPDVSLFAANGYNDSFYPICASPGDCSSTNLNSSGAVVITGVGGTSASSPAMAGIQALVNQSVGSRAGQADFLYYPLATKQPTVFHDVTMGGNQVLCYASTANCAAGTSGTLASGFNVESGYSASTGYDLATGLGSVDVANLIKYWSTVTLTATTTTLTVNPTSLVHGKTAIVSGAVTAAKGTPTGSVSLTGSDGITHYAGFDTLSLASGSMYGQIDNLPGGTYQLTAVYGGDGTFAASKSAPVVVTVTPESNTLAIAGWAWNPYDLDLYSLTSGITMPYGAQVLIDAQPVSGNATIATQTTPATGTVTFTDKLGTVTTTSAQPLNSAGVAEWSTGVFAPGSHTISAAYSGDASYNTSSAASAASFTVIQGSTSLTVKPLVTSVAAGASVAVDVQLTTGYLPLHGTLPTGSVTVTLGGKTATGTWAAFGATGNANLEAVVTFTNVAAGILPVTASYAGDTNWLGSAANGGTVIALASKLTPTVTLTSSLTSPTPAQTFTLTAIVAGPSGKTTPTGTVTFVSDDQGFSSTVALTKGTATLSVPGHSVANGTNIFTALYQGDANYNAASSNAVNVTVAQSDFSLTTQTAELAIVPAKTGTSTLALTPVNGFSGAVTLTSSAPTGITATPATASLTLSAAATDVVTLSVSASVAPGVYPVTIVATGGGHVHTAQILVAVLALAPPVFTPAAGTYTSAQAVTITEAAVGATIYYTTNGTTPTTASAKYTGAITVSATETLEAIAVATGYSNSAVATAAYTITPPAATPTFSPVAGTYTAAQTVTITDTTTGSTIYYTTNGTTPTTASTKYTAAIKVSATETLEAIAVASGYTNSAVATAAYTITPPAATPTFSPAAGTYTAAQTVTIADTTAGASIYYTTNGTAPSTASTKYTAAIKIAATETLEAIAVATGYSSSAVATAVYTITPPAATPTFSPAAGTYTAAQTVTIADTIAGASIYYTTNGTAPTTASTKYTAAIKVAATETLEAIAVATGYSSSAVATAVYTITPPAATPTFSPVAGTYTAAQTVTIATTTTGAAIYYTTNGTTPTTASTKYTTALKVSATEKLEAIAVATGYSNSAVAAAAYTITPQAATPTFSPAAGTYTAAQTVTITDSTAGATIYYTTNGTTPTTASTRYTTALKVSATETLEAIAVATGYTNSSVATAAYTVKTTVIVAPRPASPLRPSQTPQIATANPKAGR